MQGQHTHTNIIPRDRQILMRRRTNISNRLNEQIVDSDKSHLKRTLLEIENRIKHSHEKERADREARAVENIKINPKTLYKFAKESASVHYKIRPLFQGNSSLTTDSQKS